MPEITYSAASSLDGYIATPDGSVDWLAQFRSLGEDRGVGELHASVDALLLGSHTYEFALHLGRWPSPDKLSWVFTSRKLPVLHPSVTLTSETPTEITKLLDARGVRHAWLMGGGKLAASFHSEGLISRYVISVFPVLLGSGVPLFASHSCNFESLRLVTAKPFASGIVQLSYHRATNA